MLWPVFVNTPAIIRDRDTASLFRAVSFESETQQIKRVLHVPEHSAALNAVLRVELVRAYSGTAGFRVEVDGVPVGVMAPSESLSGIRWSMVLPKVLAPPGAFAVIVLRPAGIDALLALAVHPDALAEPDSVARNTFFDGRTWGPAIPARNEMPAQNGVYRMWIDAGGD